MSTRERGGAIRSYGSGRPLPATARSFFEPRFGEALSSVRIHTSAEAADLSRAFDARAFVHREDIFFSRGAYDPHSASGRRLLAHELAHTLQQRNGQGEHQFARQARADAHRTEEEPSDGYTPQKVLLQFSRLWDWSLRERALYERLDLAPLRENYARELKWYRDELAVLASFDDYLAQEQRHAIHVMGEAAGAAIRAAVGGDATSVVGPVPPESQSVVRLLGPDGTGEVVHAWHDALLRVARSRHALADELAAHHERRLRGLREQLLERKAELKDLLDKMERIEEAMERSKEARELVDLLLEIKGYHDKAKLVLTVWRDPTTLKKEVLSIAKGKTNKTDDVIKAGVARLAGYHDVSMIFTIAKVTSIGELRGMIRRRTGDVRDVLGEIGRQAEARDEAQEIADSLGVAHDSSFE